MTSKRMASDALTLEDMARAYAKTKLACLEDRRLGKPNAQRIRRRNTLAQAIANAGGLVGHDSVCDTHGDTIVTF